MRMETRRGVFKELECARGLDAAIRQAQSAIEARRELPAELAKEIAAQGMFRLLLPKALGGSALSPAAFIRVAEAIGEADGSAGWCVAQGAVFAHLADKLHPDTVHALWGRNRDEVVATGIPSEAEARRNGGAYNLSGHWRFASGCMHAGWLAALAPVVGNGGDPEPPRFFIVPKAQVQLADGWQVKGMRGTGSREYTMDGVEVPVARSLLASDFSGYRDAFTGLPSNLLFASGFGGVGLGIARRAIDTFIDLARGKTPVFANSKLQDDELVQTGLAEAEALWQATRAFLLDVAEEVEFANTNRGLVEKPLRARLRLAATHAMRRSADVVDQVYAMAGTDSIFDDHPIQRCFQDAHALTQQIQGRPSHFRTVGKSLLGLDPRDMFI